MPCLGLSADDLFDAEAINPASAKPLRNSRRSILSEWLAFESIWVSHPLYPRSQIEGLAGLIIKHKAGRDIHPVIPVFLGRTTVNLLLKLCDLVKLRFAGSGAKREPLSLVIQGGTEVAAWHVYTAMAVC